MGARSQAKARAAIEAMEKEIPDAKIEFLQMDLMDFKSVVAAAHQLRSQENVLHGLVNNAGIMGVPFQRTADDFESQFQVRSYPSRHLFSYIY
jgi:NAD(P)-dependent dehydrogenase (short-subunit alcohol dehydrogenase family)